MLRSPHFGRRLLIAMLLLAAAYLAYGMRQVWVATFMYGNGYLGMSRAETRYIYGAPAIREAGDRVWRYAGEGSVSSVGFDATGGAVRLGCSAEAGGGSCPDVLGIGIGTSEERIWSVLGTPPVQIYRENAKIIVYPELGARFLLRRLQVVAIEKRPADAGLLPFVTRSLRLLAP